MPNYDPDQDPLECADIETSLEKDATNAAERREALMWCLENKWANKKVGCLERWDDESWHGWLLWPWRKRRS